MGRWNPDPKVVKELRDRARSGADLRELVALNDSGTIKTIAHFVHTFRIPLRESKTLVDWIELDHPEAIEQRKKGFTMIQHYLANTSTDGDEL